MIPSLADQNPPVPPDNNQWSVPTTAVMSTTMEMLRARKLTRLIVRKVKIVQMAMLMSGEMKTKVARNLNQIIVLRGRMS